MHTRFSPRHKFMAKPVNDNGQHFASKLEHQFYVQLEMQRKAGDVIFFLRQVPFHLPGGVKYVCDFVVFYADEAIRFVDVKGVETSEFIMKKKMVESIYPITIDVVKKNDFRRA
jgi:hypothetical protein